MRTLCKRMLCLLYHLIGPIVVDASNVLLDVSDVVKNVAVQPMDLPLRFKMRLIQVIRLCIPDTEVLQSVASKPVDFIQSR